MSIDTNMWCWLMMLLLVVVRRWMVRLVLIHDAKLSLKFGKFSTDTLQDFYRRLFFWRVLLHCWCGLVRKVLVRYRGRWAAAGTCRGSGVVIQQRHSRRTAQRG